MSVRPGHKGYLQELEKLPTRRRHRTESVACDSNAAISDLPNPLRSSDASTRKKPEDPVKRHRRNRSETSTITSFLKREFRSDSVGSSKHTRYEVKPITVRPVGQMLSPQIVHKRKDAECANVSTSPQIAESPIPTQPYLGKFFVKVVEATNTAACSQIFLRAFEDTFSTKLVNTTVNPQWHEEFVFNIYSLPSPVDLQFKDESLNNFMGKVALEPEEFMNSGPMDEWHEVESTKLRKVKERLRLVAHLVSYDLAHGEFLSTALPQTLCSMVSPPKKREKSKRRSEDQEARKWLFRSSVLLLRKKWKGLFEFLKACAVSEISRCETAEGFSETIGQGGKLYLLLTEFGRLYARSHFQDHFREVFCQIILSEEDTLDILQLTRSFLSAIELSTKSLPYQLKLFLMFVSEEIVKKYETESHASLIGQLLISVYLPLLNNPKKYEVVDMELQSIQVKETPRSENGAKLKKLPDDAANTALSPVFKRKHVRSRSDAYAIMGRARARAEGDEEMPVPSLNMGRLLSLTPVAGRFEPHISRDFDSGNESSKSPRNLLYPPSESETEQCNGGTGLKSPRVAGNVFSLDIGQMDKAQKEKELDETLVSATEKSPRKSPKSALRKETLAVSTEDSHTILSPAFARSHKRKGSLDFAKLFSLKTKSDLGRSAERRPSTSEEPATPKSPNSLIVPVLSFKDTPSKCVRTLSFELDQPQPEKSISFDLGESKPQTCSLAQDSPNQVHTVSGDWKKRLSVKTSDLTSGETSAGFAQPPEMPNNPSEEVARQSHLSPLACEGGMGPLKASSLTLNNESDPRDSEASRPGNITPVLLFTESAGNLAGLQENPKAGPHSPIPSPSPSPKIPRAKSSDAMRNIQQGIKREGISTSDDRLANQDRRDKNNQWKEIISSNKITSVFKRQQMMTEEEVIERRKRLAQIFPEHYTSADKELHRAKTKLRYMEMVLDQLSKRKTSHDNQAFSEFISACFSGLDEMVEEFLSQAPDKSLEVKKLTKVSFKEIMVSLDVVIENINKNSEALRKDVQLKEEFWKEVELLQQFETVHRNNLIQNKRKDLEKTDLGYDPIHGRFKPN
eukprot:TRINITY_DN3361_c0_g1_i1.p1 TRINITY_DN3361_c0_g1~~TRINITY_DN3361_c0_g1_i1.p1  ORF type:complete len:1080 (-),score=315.09 TRINITY_DN3361_c0_g1_i1:33-3272(-)